METADYVVGGLVAVLAALITIVTSRTISSPGFRWESARLHHNPGYVIAQYLLCGLFLAQYPLAQDATRSALSILLGCTVIGLVLGRSSGPGQQ